MFAGNLVPQTASREAIHRPSQHSERVLALQVGGVRIDELNGMECEFLFLMAFNLHVKRAEYDAYVAELFLRIEDPVPLMGSLDIGASPTSAVFWDGFNAQPQSSGQAVPKAPKSGGFPAKHGGLYPATVQSNSGMLRLQSSFFGASTLLHSFVSTDACFGLMI